PPRGVRAVLGGVRRAARRARAAPRLLGRLAVHLQLAGAGRTARGAYRAPRRARDRRRDPLRAGAPAYVLREGAAVGDAGDGARRRAGDHAAAALADGGTVDR